MRRASICGSRKRAKSPPLIAIFAMAVIWAAVYLGVASASSTSSPTAGFSAAAMMALA